ncbi:hypothetical protein ACC719_36345, partial [Rhizobium ruizarguesonis]
LSHLCKGPLIREGYRNRGSSHENDRFRRSRRGAIPTTFLGGSPALQKIQLIALPISGIACGRGLMLADSRGWQE